MGAIEVFPNRSLSAPTGQGVKFGQDRSARAVGTKVCYSANAAVGPRSVWRPV